MASEALTFWNLAQALIERFPEIKAPVEEALADARREGGRLYPHVLLEEYFLPLLVGSIAEPSRLAKRGVQFLEELLTSGDEDVVGTALLNVVEPIAADKQRLAAAWPHMGEAARKWTTELRGRNRA